MQSQSRFFDDLARVAAGAVGTLSGVRRRDRGAGCASSLNACSPGWTWCTRDEFEAVKAMAAKARAEQEDLTRRLAELEAVVANLREAGRAETPPSPAAVRSCRNFHAEPNFVALREGAPDDFRCTSPNRHRFPAIRSTSSKRSSAPTSGRTTGPARRSWWSRFPAAGATTGLYFVWQEEICAMHFSCGFDMKVPKGRRAAVYELLALANEKLWLGHFDLSAEDNSPSFRHAVAAARRRRRRAPSRSRTWSTSRCPNASAFIRRFSSCCGAASGRARRWRRR